MCSSLVKLFSSLAEIMKSEPERIEKMAELLENLGSRCLEKQTVDSFNSEESSTTEKHHEQNEEKVSLESLKKKLDELKNRYEKKISVLTIERDNAKRELDEKNSTFSRELKEAREEIEQINGKNAELERTKKELDEKNSTFSSELKEAREEIEQINVKNVELEGSKKELEDKNVALSRELKEAREEIEQINVKNVELEGSKKELEDKNVALSRELKEAREKIEQVKNNNSELCSQIRTLEHERTNLTHRISAFKDFEQLEELNDFIVNLSNETKQKSCLREFDFDDLSILLTQAGNLQKIKNLWEVGAKETISTGSCNHELRELMLKIVDFYNRAHKDLNLKTIEPEIGVNFDAQAYSRTGGRTPDKVSEVLFPGLSNVRDVVFTKPVVR